LAGIYRHVMREPRVDFSFDTFILCGWAAIVTAAGSCIFHVASATYVCCIGNMEAEHEPRSRRYLAKKGYQGVRSRGNFARHA
jgi:hypothetical protein